MLPSGTSVGRNDGQVGEHSCKSAVIGRHHVRTEQGALAVERNGQPIGIIGAAVVQENILDAEDAAVLRHGHFSVVDLPALMGGRKEMLQPVLDPFDRPVEPHRHPWQHHFLGVEHHDLGAETAADKGRDDADLPFAQP